MQDYSQGPPPGFWTLFRRSGGIFPIVSAAATLVMTGVSSGDLRSAYALEAHGVEAQAIVVARDRRTQRTDSGTKTTYYVTLRYGLATQERDVERSVPKSFYDTRTEGQFQTIRYLPDRPDIVEFWPGRKAEQATRAQIGALFFGVVTLGAGWFVARRVVAMLRARRFGPHEVGRVIEIAQRRSRKRRVHVLVWQDACGEIGESRGSGEARYAAYGPGSEIDLYRDARGRAWWAGDIGHREERDGFSR